jgi:hypothetical protein
MPKCTQSHAMNSRALGKFIEATSNKLIIVSQNNRSFDPTAVGGLGVSSSLIIDCDGLHVSKSDGWP